MQKVDVKVSGKFRFVIKSTNGSITTDTGYQNNLILDSGLDAMIDGDNRELNYCGVGTGNTVPNKSQLKLSNEVLVTGLYPSEDIFEPKLLEIVDDTKFITYREYVSTFKNVQNLNLTEVGVAYGFSENNKTYFSRSLIKDNMGNPTSLTIKDGETLFVYYRIFQVFDKADITGQIVLNIDDTLLTYNYLIRLLTFNSVRSSPTNYTEMIGRSFSGYKHSFFSVYSRSQKEMFYPPENASENAIDYNSQYSEYGSNGFSTGVKLLPYEKGSFKRRVIYNILENTKADLDIRFVQIETTAGNYAIRFGKADDDSKLIKPATHKLSIELEFQWSRYPDN